MKKPSNLIRALSLLFLLPVVLTVQAEKKYSLGGRLFLDGGLFTASPACFNSGVGISDLRITGKADFGDGWYTKLECRICFKQSETERRLLAENEKRTHAENRLYDRDVQSGPVCQYQ